MEPADIYAICHEAIYVLIIMAMPVMLTALFIGLIISLFQALTQIQEATLTFVPKILSVFLILSLTMPFMLKTLQNYTYELDKKIAQLD